MNTHLSFQIGRWFTTVRRLFSLPTVRDAMAEASAPAPVAATPPAAPRPPAARRLAITLRGTEDNVIVRLHGEAGFAEADLLESAMLGLSACRPASVTFDLKELCSLSSLAIGLLVRYRRSAVRVGTRVCLGPELHPAVRDTLQTAGVLGLFEAPGEHPPTAEPSPVAGPKLFPNVNDVERAHGIAWDQLVDLEPQVETLLWRARTIGAGCRTMSDVDRVFSPVASELGELIGFAGKHRRHRVLGSVGAYQVAYWKLYEAVTGL